MKQQYKIVEDFFGADAARVYCGENPNKRTRRWVILSIAIMAAITVVMVATVVANASFALNCQEVYRIETQGSHENYTNVIDIVDNRRASIGQAFDGDRFIRDTCAKQPELDRRYYGTVEGRNLTGYVLQEKLKRE